MEKSINAPDKIETHPRVPLTRFHNNTGEFLDMAIKQPLVLTSHGRDRQVIMDSDYFKHLEKAAAGTIIAGMKVEAVSSSDMTEADARAFANARPTANELKNDRWDD
jgi:hypothetical protein